MGSVRELSHTVAGREQDEGVGARVRRTIGSRGLHRLDPFLLLDEFKGQWPDGFPDHPHRGFETVSYLLDGSFQHEDFTGAAGTLKTGDVQWMTAGRGIVHSEIPGKGAGPCRGLQLWINLKHKDKMVPPRYQEKQAKEIPSKSENGVTVRVIAGESMGLKSPIHTYTPAYYLDFALQPGSSFTQPVPPGWATSFYVVDGSVKTGSKQVKAHELAVFKDEGDSVSFSNESEGEARLVLIAGEPIGEPVIQHGPFVLTNENDLQQTFADYQMGKNGFERAPGWKSKQGTEALRARQKRDL